MSASPSHLGPKRCVESFSNRRLDCRKEDYGLGNGLKLNFRIAVSY
jgi:hypothetical protein